MKIYLSAFLVLVAMAGCTTGNCRSQKEAQVKSDEKAANPSALTPMTTELDRIKVYKYDGSLQCGMGKAIPVETMQKEFKEIKVYSAARLPDGLMHIQQCGTPTGQANVYEIDKKDLEAAKKLGFKLWTAQ